MGITRKIAYVFGFLGLTATIGCHHTVAKNQPVVPPAQASPSATLAANPANIQRGQATTLSWQTANADNISIQNLGVVTASGSRSIYPSDSTTYELVAKGPGGTGTASARVTVNVPYARQTESGTDGRDASVEDVYFDYDRYNIRNDQMSLLQADVRYLEHHDAVRIQIEGHCDERGSAEYNLALGAKRASEVEKYLRQSGVPKGRLQTVSYGKEKPFCSQANEQCWSQNRRDHFNSQQ